MVEPTVTAPAELEENDDDLIPARGIFASILLSSAFIILALLILIFILWVTHH